MHAIHKKYMCNHVHDATLLQIILKELAGANGIQFLKDASAQAQGLRIRLLNWFPTSKQWWVRIPTQCTPKLMYGMSSDSNLFEEERKPQAGKRKNSQCFKSQGRKGNQKKDKDKELKKNTCPHCKKFHCKKPHQVEPDKCMWNKKYKGYCFKLICNKLKLAFNSCHKFSAELGGYVCKQG
jgi:hypothetical protein